MAKRIRTTLEVLQAKEEALESVYRGFERCLEEFKAGKRSQADLGISIQLCNIFEQDFLLRQRQIREERLKRVPSARSGLSMEMELKRQVALQFLEEQLKGNIEYQKVKKRVESENQAEERFEKDNPFHDY